MNGSANDVTAARECGPVLVGGPARNGKTMLANMIGGASISYFGIPFELLLNVYKLDWTAWRRTGRRNVLEEYVQRRRSIVPDGSKTSGPSDFIAVSELCDLLEGASWQGGIVQGVAYILAQIARRRGAKTWIGADYHAECDYRRLASVIPGLRLIVAMRDPLEAVCASLYWRHYPQRHPSASSELKYRVAAWRLAAAVALRLKQTHPDDVLILDMNRLWSGETKSIDALAAFLHCDAQKLRPAVLGRPWFSRTEGGRFLCPDGSERALLSTAEIDDIETATAQIAKALDQAEQGVAPRSIALPGIISAMARAPRISRFLVTSRHRPRERLAKSLSRIRRSVRLLATT
jgi:hypothetical protein